MMQINISDMQRVNSLIKLQDDLIRQYELYQTLIEKNENQSLIETLKEEIDLTKKSIHQIKVLRIAEILSKE